MGWRPEYQPGSNMGRRTHCVSRVVGLDGCKRNSPRGIRERKEKEKEITGRKPPGKSIPSFLDANHRLRGFAQEERFLR
ncbi:hypothetical protein LWI29_023605 [Acer saccharum]|uniref:Uncharacterized protein n=1 Tax=Acer saccharum TaxID=4024 RepID=A0AA39VFU9_ACESA|nr:hypothetical protein LWI29_023605 [Acer saccharum]